MSLESKTKYIIVVPDGMGDLPIPELGDRTPLEAAHTPWMDKMASAGTIGLARTVPLGMEPGSDVANLSILGYSPQDVYTGRAPFEAASMGVELGPNDLAFRLNFVNLDRNFTVMGDHSAEHISSIEARQLLEALQPYAESLGLTLYPGVSYRNLLVWENGPDSCVTYPPHDFPGQPVADRLPKGDCAAVLLRLIVKSWKVLEQHPVNVRRSQRCKKAANSVWPWGHGKRPKLRTLRENFGISGSVVAAVDLMKGIGKCAGLEPIEVPGATGYLDTNYAGKVHAALESLRRKDFVYLHVEAPDEASHSGYLDLKKSAIEDFDEKVVGPLLEGLNEFSSWRLLLMPDHRTPVELRTHSTDPVPFIQLDSNEWGNARKEAKKHFSEVSAERSGVFVEDASTMIAHLLEKSTS
ncbi:MAG: cofactor-independent phosphoglycerate mutase [Desulfomonile sp.]|nr:cofactor-independent phosphoglycerate mutase [Desulfomonile sp.]